MLKHDQHNEIAEITLNNENRQNIRLASLL